MQITIENQGPIIRATNYWQTPQAKAGGLYLSWNAGAARLLAPGLTETDFADMRSAREVVVTRGPWRDVDAYELLFEDDSDAPYSVCLGVHQSDRLLPASDDGKKIRVLVYSPKGLEVDLPGRFVAKRA